MLQRTPLSRKTPLRQTKPLAKRAPLKSRKRRRPAAVREHYERVAALGCLVCGAPATNHHVTGYADKPGRFSPDQWLIVPLCPIHHQKVYDPLNRDPQSVEGLGHQGFYDKHGIDLLAEAMRLAEETQRG